MAHFPSAAGSDAFYTFNQGSPAATWTITHGLNKFPSVSVVDSAGDQVEGDIEYINSNQVVAKFSAPFAGKAYLN